MPATFNVPDKFEAKKSFSRIIFGDDAYLMEVELNELQKIMDEKLRVTSSSLLSDGFVQTPALTITSGFNLPPSRIVVNGRVLDIGTTLTLNVSEGDSVFLAVWDEVVKFQDSIPEYGNMNNGTPLTDNGILDTRAGESGGEETTRRLQTRFQLVKEANPSETNKYFMPIADIGDPAITDNIIDKRVKAAITVSSSDMSLMFGTTVLDSFNSKKTYPTPFEIINAKKDSILDLSSIVGRSRINYMPEIDGDSGITRYVVAADDQLTPLDPPITLSRDSSWKTSGSSSVKLTKNDDVVYFQPITPTKVRHKVFARKDECFIAIIDADILSYVTFIEAALSFSADPGMTVSNSIISLLSSSTMGSQPVISLIKVISAPAQGGNVYPSVRINGGSGTLSLDSFRMFKISSATYNQISADLDPDNSSIPYDKMLNYLCAAYPYTRGIAGVFNPTISKQSTNLLPPFNKWLNGRTFDNLSDNPYSMNFVAATTIFTYVRVVPGVYTFKYQKNRTQLKIELFDFGREIVSSPNPLVNTTNTISDSVVTFEVPDKAVTVKITLTLGSGANDPVSNAMLYRGDDVNLPFSPAEDNSVYFKTELFGDEAGNAQDSIIPNGNGSYTKVKKWESKYLDPFAVTIGGTAKINDTVRLISLEGFKAAFSYNSLYFKRYDGVFLNTYYDSYVAGADNSYFVINTSSSQSSLTLTTHVSESGWGPNYVPTEGEMRALLAGWKMYDGTASDGAFTGADGQRKYWRRYDVPASTASLNDGTAVDVLPTKPYPGFTPSQILYRLMFSELESVSSEGSVRLTKGENIIEYRMGIVRRERVYPSVISANYYINYSSIGTGDSSWTSYPALEITEVYKNQSIDIDWKYGELGSSALNGVSYVIKGRELFDLNGEYYVDYVVSNSFAIPDVMGLIAANEAAQFSVLTEKVNEAISVATESQSKIKEEHISTRKFAQDMLENEVAALPVTPTTITASEGTSLIEVKQPTDLDTIIYGKTLDNLLGDAGDFEDLTKWNYSGNTGHTVSLRSNTGDTSLFGYGQSALRIDGPLTGIYKVYKNNLFSDPLLKLYAGRKYVILADLKGDGVTNADIGLYVGGPDTEPIAWSGFKNTTTVLFAKYEATADLTDVQFVVAKRASEGDATTGTVIIDGAGVYEVSAEMYDRIGKDVNESNIRNFFPHVNGMQHINNIAITKESRNLIKHYPDHRYLDELAPYSVEITDTASSPTRSVAYRLDLIPNEMYTIRVEVPYGAGFVRWNVSTLYGVTGAEVLFPVQVSTATITFKAPATKKLVYLNLYYANSSSRRVFKNMQMNMGTEILPFEPYVPQRAILPVTIGSMLGERDKVYRENSDWYHEKSVMLGVPIHGLIQDAFTATLVAGADGYRVLANVNSLFGIKTNSPEVRGVKWNNDRLIGKIGDDASALSIYSTSGGNLSFFIPNSESGWNNTVTPTSDNIKAFLNGWRAQGYTGSVYDTWRSIRTSALPKMNTSPYVSSNFAPNWSAYFVLDYVLKAPFTVPLRDASGDITLHSGKNIVKVESGVIIRELNQFNQRNIGGEAILGRDTTFPNAMKYRLKALVASYRNGIEYPFFRTVYNSAPDIYGLVYLSVAQNYYDKVSLFEFTYSSIDKHMISASIDQIDFKYRDEKVGTTLESMDNMLSRYAYDASLVRKHEDVLGAMSELSGNTNLVKNSSGLLGRNNWSFSNGTGPGWGIETASDSIVYRFANRNADPAVTGLLNSYSYLYSDPIGVQAGLYTVSVELFNSNPDVELLVLVTTSANTTVSIAKLRSTSSGKWESLSASFYRQSASTLYIHILSKGAAAGDVRLARKIMLNEGRYPAPYNIYGDVIAMKEQLLTADSVNYNQTRQIFVDAVNGNDSNTGTSASDAVKTIQKAIDIAPKVVNGSLYIVIAPGTYTQFQLINFKGTGFISIYASGAVASTILNVATNTSVNIMGNVPEVRVSSLTINRASGNQPIIQVTTGKDNTTFTGLILDGGSINAIAINQQTCNTEIANCTFKNIPTSFIQVLYRSRASIHDNTFTNVSTNGVQTAYGSISHIYSGGSPSGATNSATSGSLNISN